MDPLFLTWVTNNQAVFAAFRVSDPTNATDQFGRLFRPPMPPPTPEQASTRYEFVHYLPESLNHLVWTNFIAHTNGRTTQIWSTRLHPPEWPAKPPVVVWNTNSILWGMRGFTALSPCWEGELSPGQIPITALTHRHGYTRGHSMGPDGFGTRFAGKKVWFVDARNKVHEFRIVREVVRTAKSGLHIDYTIFLFDRDLPVSIQPPMVADQVQVYKKLGMPKLPYGAPAVPRPLFMTEQAGHVSASVPGFTVRTGKAGDSGSPTLLPLPGQLVFLGGATTSTPTEAMQSDMDTLCRQAGLDPTRYQLQWADLSAYHIY